MTTFRCASLLALVAIAVAGGDRDERFSAGAQAVAESLRQGILTEIAGLGEHEWAGNYYEGDGMGENVSLAIAPRGGFVFEWHGCLGCYDRNYGTVDVVDGQLRLAFTFENERKGFKGLAPTLVPMAWGERQYLVPADDVIGFCNEVNQGNEPRANAHGRYLLRQGDEGRHVTGWPDVPAEYRDCLLAQPVTATVMAVGEPSTRPSLTTFNFLEFPMSIDAGRQQGLRPGMELYVTEPARTVERVRLGTVEDQRAEGVMIQTDDHPRPPQVGWKLSTWPPWRPLDAK
ncbi:MAG TPA: hypothetical protein VFY71_17280 [Planctomycetota bacterium]|nr:hypothetical protein [Planctomycetota bacterium]